MDLSKPHDLRVFLDLYGRLPRAGPGGDVYTRRALDLVPNGPPRRVVDLGCGPGAQTLALARALPHARVLGIDILKAMVDEASRRAAAAGLTGRVEFRVGDMGAPDVSAGTQDLVWCEGAIYFLGVATALARWRPMLRTGGAIAFTEAIWLKPDPPPELARWWTQQHPAITDEAGVRAAVQAASFETIGFFPLPASAWWDEYYRPMESRIPTFVARHDDDPVASEVARTARQEIDFFRRFSDWYGYGFFVTTPA